MGEWEFGGRIVDIWLRVEGWKFGGRVERDGQRPLEGVAGLPGCKPGVLPISAKRAVNRDGRERAGTGGRPGQHPKSFLRFFFIWC